MSWDFAELFIVCMSNYLTSLLEEIRDKIRYARIEVMYIQSIDTFKYPHVMGEHTCSTVRVAIPFVFGNCIKIDFSHPFLK